MPSIDNLFDKNRVVVGKKMNIALIGFMGSGKSSVGNYVARAMNYTLLDTDALIVRETNSSIAQLFAQKGEGYFRMLEQKILDNIHLLDKYVLATGGGMPVQPNAMHLLKKAAVVVFLKPKDTSILLQRLRQNPQRPLLQQQNPHWEEEALELYAKRLEFYTQAHLSVDCSHQNVPETAKLVMRTLSVYTQTTAQA